MSSIIAYLKGKPYRVLVVFNVLTVLFLLFFLRTFGGLQSRYALYFFAGPVILFILFNIKSIFIKVTLPLFFIIFIENIVISSVPVAGFVRIGGALILALIALLSIYNYQKMEKLPRLFDAQWFVYFVFIVISFIIGITTHPELFGLNVEALLTYYIEFFLYFYLGYQAFRNVKTASDFMTLLVIFGALSAGGHIFSMLTGINLELVRGESAVAASRDLSEGNWRYGGFFGNVNTMSAFYVMLVPAAVYLVFNSKTLIVKILAGISIGAMIISLLMGASRGGLLFVVLNTFIILFFMKISVKNIFTGLITAAVLIIVLNSVLDSFFTEFIDRAFEEMNRKGTDSPREVIWYFTMGIIQENPLGLGLSTFNFSDALRKAGNIFWANPHNMYLEMTTQTGIGGLLLFLTIIGRIIWSVIKALGRTDDYQERTALVTALSVIMGFMIMGFTEPVFRNQYKLNHIFGIVSGLSLFLSHKVVQNSFLINAIPEAVNGTKILPD